MGFPIAERFLYLPSVFFFLLLGGLLPRKEASPRALAAAGALVLFFWSVLTVHRNRDWREEGAFFRKLVRENPSSSYLYAALGEHLIRAGEPAGGTAALEKAADLEKGREGKNQARLLNNLAAAYRLQGREEEAARFLEKARAAGGSGSALDYNAGMVYLNQDRFAAAAAAFQSSLRINPDFADAWLGLGRLYRRMGKPLPALACFRKAVSLYPDSAELHNRLGVAAREAGDYRLSLREFSRALRLDPGLHSARVNRGVLFALLNRLDSARSDLEAAVAEQPDSWDAQNSLGMVYARQGKGKLAYSKFEEIIINSPQNADAHLNLGILDYQGGNIEEARREFRAVLELKPDHRRARAFLELLDSSLKNKYTITTKARRTRS
jgi:tetratricopeptide (TPR) repeat protein